MIKIRSRGVKERSRHMNGNKKRQETFIVKIKGTENATWQGSVTWIEQNKKQNFRSALELMKMLDAALKEEEKNGTA